MVEARLSRAEGTGFPDDGLVLDVRTITLRRLGATAGAGLLALACCCLSFLAFGTARVFVRLLGAG